MIARPYFTWRVVLSWVVLLHAATFLLFWMTNRYFYVDTNQYLAGMTGLAWDFISLCLGFAAVLLGWSAVQVVWATPPAAASPLWRKVGNALVAGLGALFVLFFYGSFALLFHESPVQMTRLIYLFQYFRFWFDILVWIGLVFLAYRLALRWPRRRWWLAAFLVVTYVGAAFLPPGSVYVTLPKKPLLVAHRGASMLAPENTVFSAGVALELGAGGLESDVRVSQDGQLFLLHDPTLTRTTNVEEIFPDRANQRAEYFPYAELDQLDYTSWFVQDDPFETLQNDVVNRYTNAYLLDRYETDRFGVPVFSDWLEFLRLEQMVFIFDLQTPPEDHPYAGQMLELALAEIRAAGVEDRIWLLLSPEQNTAIATAYPSITRAAGVGSASPPPAAQLVDQGFQLVNAEFDLPLPAIRSYHDAGLWVNLWTVDEPWLFSFLWLHGVDSITTNNVHTFSEMESPFLALSSKVHGVLWSALMGGGISAFWFGLRRSQSKTI